jgi:hypothetical protein
MPARSPITRGGPLRLRRVDWTSCRHQLGRGAISQRGRSRSLRNNRTPRRSRLRHACEWRLGNLESMSRKAGECSWMRPERGDARYLPDARAVIHLADFPDARGERPFESDQVVACCGKWPWGLDQKPPATFLPEHRDALKPRESPNLQCPSRFGLGASDRCSGGRNGQRGPGLDLALEDAELPAAIAGAKLTRFGSWIPLADPNLSKGSAMRRPPTSARRRHAAVVRVVRGVLRGRRARPQVDVGTSTAGAAWHACESNAFRGKSQ